MGTVNNKRRYFNNYFDIILLNTNRCNLYLWTMLKKNSTFCVYHIFFSFLLIIFSPGSTLCQTTTPEPNNQTTKIILGGDLNFPPSTFMKNGQPGGYMVDVTRAVAEAVGLDIQVQLMPWKAALEKLSKGELDVVAMSYSDKRARAYEFSVQFALNAFGLMVKNNSDITGIKDIQGHNILVQQGGVMRDYIDSHRINARFTYMKDVKSILLELKNNQFDGAFLSKKTGYFLANQLGISGLKFTKENISPRKTVFAVTKGNYELVQFLNEGLSIIHANGQLKAINEKWFGSVPGGAIDLDTIKTWGFRIGFGILIIISLVFMWNRFLQAEINRRKLIEKDLMESEQRYRTIFNNSPMGIYVFRLESDDRLILESANMAADHLTGITNADLIELTINEAFPALVNTEIPEAYRLAASKGVPWRTENIDYDDNVIRGAFEVQAFQSSPGRVTVVFSNITERKCAEVEKEELIHSLQEALDEVKKLSGMLPICSSCKKIRDDNGYWNQVEAYIVDHSDAEFSHSICPECAKRLYPEFDIYED